MPQFIRWPAVVVFFGLVAGCATNPAPVALPATRPGLAAALQAINGPQMLQQIETLASDDFEGRSAGTHGEAVTVDYLIGEFKRIGLKPGNPDGTYVQSVPLTGHAAEPTASIQVGRQRMALKFPDDYVAWSYQRQAEVRLEKSELVFVGYGVTAPEYQWDDYKGANLKGKTLVMLINDPQIPDPHDPGKLDEAMFQGKTMTYYGRWTYKYETAAALGAAGVLIVHETEPAAYPYSVVVNSNSGENFDIHTAGDNRNFPAVPGWIHLDRAKELFAAAGYDFDTIKKAALRRDFKPMALGGSIDVSVRKKWRDLDSHNVVGRIEGADPELKHEVVIYSAHWDHFGWDPKLPGTKHQQVYHGAADNASGVAALLQLAQAFQALPQPPKRTILFMATTAEERGLLGSSYYAANPLYPLRKTLADINMDGMNMWGRTRDLEIVGYGNSELDDLVIEEAGAQGRVVGPDAYSEKGSFYRADHFEFAKVGVPALYAKSGHEYIGRPPGYGKERSDDYTSHDYHKVSDTVRPDWDLTGAIEDIQLLFRVGYAVAQGERYPAWKPGSEFKARRDEMMGFSRR
ncbi:MAG: M20/M25/M40 family metallo-hydrolase [Proteobacteria bacterium]|nr:M20/M25/M40 family metallo-hydrolase [Pseudomonadota bacterium]